jgi:hypothetical protein
VLGGERPAGLVADLEAVGGLLRRSGHELRGRAVAGQARRLLVRVEPPSRRVDEDDALVETREDVLEQLPRHPRRHAPQGTAGRLTPTGGTSDTGSAAPCCLTSVVYDVIVLSS